MRSLERLLWGKRKLAVAVMTIALLGIVMVPFLAGAVAVVKNVDGIARFAQKLSTYQLPPAPAWLAKSRWSARRRRTPGTAARRSASRRSSRGPRPT